MEFDQLSYFAIRGLCRYVNFFQILLLILKNIGNRMLTNATIFCYGVKGYKDCVRTCLQINARNQICNLLNFTAL